VTADFGSLVALNASQTYMLAFCVTGGGSTLYTVSAIASEDTFRFCNAADCATKDLEQWTPITAIACIPRSSEAAPLLTLA
jgi:hypothetical protein